MDAMSTGTITGRSNGQQGERALLQENFRDWVLCYICNAATDSNRSGRLGKRLGRRAITTSTSVVVWPFRFSERCYAPRPMSSLRQGSEKARMRVQSQRA